MKGREQDQQSVTCFVIESTHELVAEEGEGSVVEVGIEESDCVEFATPFSSEEDAVAEPVTDADTLSIVEVALNPEADSMLEAGCEAAELSAVEEPPEGAREEEEFVVSSVELVLAVAVG